MNEQKNENKSTRQMRMRRVLIIASMMVLVAAASVGGTIAWLKDNTTPITNTFAPTGIEIELTETTDVGTDNTFDLIPGVSYQKDPVVKVLGTTNVPIYLFVKFEEKGNPADYLTYISLLNSDNGWNLVSEGSNVWYRVVDPEPVDREFHLLKLLKKEEEVEKHVTVNADLGKEDMPNENTVQLIYTAYAIQTAGFGSAEAAWQEISSASNSSTGN